MTKLRLTLQHSTAATALQPSHSKSHSHYQPLHSHQIPVSSIASSRVHPFAHCCCLLPSSTTRLIWSHSSARVSFHRPLLRLSAMARLSHLFLLALVFCSSLLSGSWAAADDTDSPAPKETTPPTQRRVKISQQDYPYGKPKEATGVKFSEYQSLAVPPYILVVVLILFLGAAAYVIYKIFDTQQEKGQPTTPPRTAQHSICSTAATHVCQLSQQSHPATTRPSVHPSDHPSCLCRVAVLVVCCRAQEGGEGEGEGGQEGAQGTEGQQEGQQEGGVRVTRQQAGYRMQQRGRGKRREARSAVRTRLSCILCD